MPMQQQNSNVVELFEYPDLPGLKWNRFREDAFKRTITEEHYYRCRQEIVAKVAQYPGSFHYVGRYDPSNLQTYYLATTDLLPNLIGEQVETLLTTYQENTKDITLQKFLKCMPEKHRNDFINAIDERRQATLEVIGVNELEPFYFLMDNRCLEGVQEQYKGVYIVEFSEVCIPQVVNSIRDGMRNSFLLCGFRYCPIGEAIYSTLSFLPLDSLQKFEPSNLRVTAYNQYEKELNSELSRQDVGLVDMKFLLDEIKQFENVVQKKARDLIKKEYESEVKEDTHICFQEKVRGNSKLLVVAWYPDKSGIQKTKHVERSLGSVYNLSNKTIITVI